MPGIASGTLTTAVITTGHVGQTLFRALTPAAP